MMTLHQRQPESCK